MKLIRNISLLLLLLVSVKAEAQELQAKITINSSRVSSVVDKKVFQTLQGALNNLLNNHKWTSETFQQNEKIVCNFMLNIVEGSDNVYTASMIVQAARPIFNTSYESPLINWQDENVVFKYIEFQPVVFNENRVSGSDGLASNLTAVLAYYVYIILGLDFDSFALKGGDEFFQKAQNIVNNAPEGRDISGWRAFDGLRNRYWLMENLTNNRYSVFHDAYYTYYRKGFDKLYENELEGRSSILASLGQLNTMNNDIP